jgi:hypothetical protein
MAAFQCLPAADICVNKRTSILMRYAKGCGRETGDYKTTVISSDTNFVNAGLEFIIIIIIIIIIYNPFLCRFL